MALEALEMFCEHGAILRPLETKEALRQALAQPVDAAIVAEVGIWGEENPHDHVDTVTNSTNTVQNPHKHKEKNMTDDITVSIDWDTAQRIAIRVLQKDLACLRADWVKRYNDKEDGVVLCGSGIFLSDVQEDLEEISAHISAYKKIIRYYGGDIN